MTYPLVGSPIANGTTLTVARILPYTQNITIANQGDFSPQVIEEMGDTLEMQIQQLAARTTQFRGTWKTGVSYTTGDIVQDGTNGLDTLNYYIAQVGNVSGTWSTDLASGYWAISALASVPTGNLTLTGDVAGSGVTPIATTLATVNSNVGAFTNASITVNAKGLVTAASSGSATSGTVTSVTFTGDGVLQSSTPSSAVTTSGTLAAALISQAANKVLSGPSSGGNATPTFRSLVSADIPASVSLVTPLLGTPTSGNLSNCTNVPVSLMTALGVGSIIFGTTNATINPAVPGTPQAASHITPVYLAAGPGIASSGDSIAGTWNPLMSNGSANTANLTLWQRVT